MTKFEKQLHDMFDHIWDCEIDHPVFQDTVGELMSAVIQAYNNSAQPEIIRCKVCKHWGKRGLCGKWDQYISNGDFYCGCAERRTND